MLAENGDESPPPYDGSRGQSGGGGSGGGDDDGGDGRVFEIDGLGAGPYNRNRGSLRLRNYDAQNATGVIGGVGGHETDGRGAGPYNTNRGSLRLRNYDAQNATTTRSVV